MMEASSQDPSSASSASSEWVTIATENELREKGRKTALVSGRKITVFCRDGGFYALDFHCYHAGGPLDVGNIEDINGVSCVVCPWHKYKISLATGEGFYQAVDPQNPRQAPCWRSKGVKQRTHSVEVRDGTVYVKLSTSSAKHESDFYYSKEYQQLMGLNEEVS
ncbi:Rieske domain-containing protein-like [Patiria miniata]|uniref:Rieske domain-containing protein n=1 Tax=Patiria miniata TaxID=46514 RepID=A0A913YWA6_PATMI|nr:Rieske domain-containing protein-like [Patiria miniata]XP_038044079.1 Rieske domain-containing protein-like [Patiria miniata]XP_038044080.1 Rieske domain-containing protein-like [Patiria miniata]XP_038044081.1 Rieske domain-containing protein-like [Patiria miniata]